MIINQGSLGAIFTGYKTIFNQAFSGVAASWPRVAMLSPSGGETETYDWLGAFPKMREWLGDRVIQNLKAWGYTITNREWEVTVSVPRTKIEDDKFGVFNPMMAEMGRSAAAHPDELIWALLVDGFDHTCFDGQYFFDDDHPVGIGDAEASVSNYGGGASTAWYLLDTSRSIKPLVFQRRKEPNFVSLTAEGDANVFFKKEYIYGVDCRDNVGYGLWQLAYGSKQTLNATNYASARAAMIAFKDDYGKPLGVVPNVLAFGPNLESAARKLLVNDRNDAGATNEWAGTAEPLMIPWLT